VTQTIGIADISVLMPIKNGRKFLESSLIRILEMANEAEILLIDDGSYDGTFEYCQSFSEERTNLRVMRNPGNGICDALNFGIAASTRNWIARFDVDDEYAVNRLAEQIKVINTTNASLVFTGYVFFGDGTLPLGSIPGGVLDAPTKLSLITGRRTPHPSAVFSKEKCLKAGGYLSQDAPAEDLSLWLRMCSLGEFATTETDLLNYRLSASSTTLMNREISINQRKALLLKYPLNNEYFEEVLKNLDSILNRYSTMQSQPRRVVLLFLDIYKYSRFYGIRIPLSIFLKITGHMINVQNSREFLHLLLEARRRNNFRKSIKP
jgi:glycosyltransferase involved in cell wall biosynthesis